MSLMKSFNFNFLKQNIKKSKGGIIISLIIVPLIISIGMVVSGINSDSSEFITPESLCQSIERQCLLQIQLAELL